MLNFIRKWSASSQPDAISNLERQLQVVSIRGRVAYGATCLETTLTSAATDTAQFMPLLACLWEFTSSMDLSEWEEKIMDFYSESVLDNSEEINSLSLESSQRLRANYAALSTSQLACIDEAIEIGRGNLYGGIVGHSAATLASTMHLVRYLQAHGYPLPLIDKFLRSPFSQENQHGWGEPVDRNFFD
ncbi:hypothetical protein [Hymenobacter sp. BT559]|uniref:hypothetical protein n=1 Tax=Hymenobacter sp. BT559 TaxID=2795729 RepID=UPI0018EDF90F|nr:hypothetical protein [Hymenobacter sp. BT559]MBJ6145336.1 hypothetical protein [Hymenobacter sp. BT559]